MNQADSVTVVDGDPTSPVILHVPHSATTIPGWVRDRIVLDDAALVIELGRMTDAGTDTVVYAAASHAARRPWLVVNRLSRLVVDPERFPDEREEMREAGMGAVYTRSSHGEQLRPADPAHEHDLLAAFFHPYAQAITTLVEQRLAATGRAVIVDVHSYPQRRLPYERHPDRRRPAVCLGVDDQHTPGWLLTAATAAFAAIGDIAVNEPFAGTYVPLRHYEAGNTRVASVMVELRRTEAARPSGGRDPLPSGTAQALASLVDAATDRPGEPRPGPPGMCRTSARPWTSTNHQETSEETMTTARTACVAPRTLHVVDADNLTGGPTEHQCVADRAARLYCEAAGVRDGDLVVVGSDLRSAAVTAFAWPGARLLRTTGTDAVDRLLLDDLVPSLVVGRVERVVVGSGDGIFATRLAQLRAAGVRVEVVAPAGSVSWRLFPAAHHVGRIEAASGCTHQMCRLPVGRVSLRLAA